MLADLSQTIAEDSELASDQELAQSTLMAVGSVLGGENSSASSSAADATTDYQKMDEDTFKALAQTVDSLMTSSASGTEGVKDAGT